MAGSSGDEIIAAQIEYYRARAPEYDDTFRGSTDAALIAELDRFRPRGRVLELAAGTGAWSRAVLRHPVERLVAVDAAPEMLALHARRIADPRVELRIADLFAWTSDERYDVVTFAFWLSHVPPARFRDFWQRVRDAVEEDGRVLFVDQDVRGLVDEQPTGTDYPTVARRLRDGSQMTAIKVYHAAGQLESDIRALGWTAEVRPVGSGFLVGTARPGDGRASLRPADPPAAR